MSHGALVSRIIIACTWLALPLSLLIDIPPRLFASLTVFLCFMFISQALQAITIRHLIDHKHVIKDIIMIILFGPLETQRLRQRHKNDSLEPGNALENPHRQPS